MGRKCASSEIEKAQIKVLSDKRFSFSVIAGDIKRFRKVISNFLQDQEAYGTKKSIGLDIPRSRAQPPAEEYYEKLHGKE